LTVLPDSPGSNMPAIPSTKTPEPCRDSRGASMGQRNEGPHGNSISENASNVSNLQPAAWHPVSTSQNHWIGSPASEQVSNRDPVPGRCLPAPMDQMNESSHSSISENASNVSDLWPAASYPDPTTSQNYWVASTPSEHVSEPDPFPRGYPPAPLLPYGMQAPPSVNQPHIEYAWPNNTHAVGAQFAHPEAGQHWMFQNGDMCDCGSVYGLGLGPQGDVNATQASGYQQWSYPC
jgi:hypothetical protein